MDLSPYGGWMARTVKRTASSEVTAIINAARPYLHLPRLLARNLRDIPHTAEKQPPGANVAYVADLVGALLFLSFLLLPPLCSLTRLIQAFTCMVTASPVMRKPTHMFALCHAVLRRPL